MVPISTADSRATQRVCFVGKVEWKRNARPRCAKLASYAHSLTAGPSSLVSHGST